MIMRFIAVALACVFGVAGTTAAQPAYPTKPIRLVVPFAVGGGTDIISRLIGARMTVELGQPIVIENRAGGGAVIGTDAVAKAAPDGYTILMGEISAMSINPWLYSRLPYNPATDFAPIGQVTTSSFILSVHASVPTTDLQGLAALIRANPGKYQYGTPGVGTMVNLCGERMKEMLGGLDLPHLPYRGAGPVMIDLISGQLPIGFPTPSTLLPQIAAGTMRPIGATTMTREKTLPDVPTLAEQGLADLECYAWFGLFAPAKTPAPVIAKLAAAMQTALADQLVAKRLSELGMEPTPGRSPEALAALATADREKWGPVVKAIGARLD